MPLTEVKHSTRGSVEEWRGVSVYSGYQNRIPQPGWLTQQKSIFHSSGGWKSRSRFQLVSFLERPLLSLQLAKSCLPVKFSDGLFSVQKLKGGEKRGRERSGRCSLGSFLIRTLLPLIRTSPV